MGAASSSWAMNPPPPALELSSARVPDEQIQLVKRVKDFEVTMTYALTSHTLVARFFSGKPSVFSENRNAAAEVFPPHQKAATGNSSTSCHATV